MIPKLTASLRKALHQLEAEKQRLDRECAAVRAALQALGETGRGTPASSAPGRTGQRLLSPAARRALSQRMTAYWAKRRAASTKAKTKEAPTGK